MLRPLDVIRPEDVEFDGDDNGAWRCCGLCGTTSSKFMNKATDRWMVAVAQLRRYRDRYTCTRALTFKDVFYLWAYDLALHGANFQFGNVRIESNAPQHIIVRPREGGMTDAKTDEVLIDSL